jgi:hypothetical protein
MLPPARFDRDFFAPAGNRLMGDGLDGAMVRMNAMSRQGHPLIARAPESV